MLHSWQFRQLRQRRPEQLQREQQQQQRRLRQERAGPGVQSGRGVLRPRLPAAGQTTEKERSVAENLLRRFQRFRKCLTNTDTHTNNQSDTDTNTHTHTADTNTNTLVWDLLKTIDDWNRSTHASRAEHLNNVDYLKFEVVQA